MKTTYSFKIFLYAAKGAGGRTDGRTEHFYSGLSRNSCVKAERNRNYQEKHIWTVRLNVENYTEVHLTFRHRASSILGQAFRYSPEKAFYIFNQQIYFII